MVAAKEPADERGATFRMLRDVAISTGAYVIGGSFPEEIENSDKMYNTCCCFDPSGNMTLKHRKQHLMDVDMPG